jgi:hypothetical protein
MIRDSKQIYACGLTGVFDKQIKTLGGVAIGKDVCNVTRLAEDDFKAIERVNEKVLRIS